MLFGRKWFRPLPRRLHWNMCTLTAPITLEGCGKSDHISSPFVAVTVSGKPVHLTIRKPRTTYQPVMQPKTARGVADMTGLKVWASAYKVD